MQYENIILELLSRIKKLEDDVNELKQFKNSFTSVQSNNTNENLSENNPVTIRNTNGPYKRMTDEMIDLCYKYGKKVAEGESVQELADKVSDSTGMNKNSAIMYLYAVQSMLEGTIYKRAINSKAIKKYYNNILNEYGSEGLKKAVRATRLHIDYRKSYGQNVDSIEEICNSYENKLKK